MKVFVFTYERFNTITTSEYLKNVPHIVLCHTAEQKEKFLEAGRVYGELINTNQPRGLAYNRNVALEMMKEGEWALFFVDDLISCTWLSHRPNEERLGITIENQHLFRKWFKDDCNAENLLQITEQNISIAETKGFCLTGFANSTNPLFRDKHYIYHSLVDGRCFAIKKTHLLYDMNVQAMDDCFITCSNLRDFGGVVIDNWVLPLCARNTPGGMGTKDERMENKFREIEFLLKNFPDYIETIERKGWPSGSRIRIKRKKKKSENNQILFDGLR